MNKNVLYKVVKKHGDTLTPVSIFNILDGDKMFLLESSFIHETKGKYSFIGVNPIQEITGQKNVTTVHHFKSNEQERFEKNTLIYMKEDLPKIEVQLPFPFFGGAVGYVSYDAVHAFVDIKGQAEDQLQMPDSHFLIYDTVIIYEHRTETAHLVTFALQNENEAELIERLRNLSKQLDQEHSLPPYPKSDLQFKPQQSKEYFMKQVETAKKRMEAENIEQVVLSQRMEAKLDQDPFSIYRNLRIANPSPYMFYIDFGPYIVTGASPESLVQTTGNKVVTNPIAGTRPRGKNDADDKRLSEELLQDEKELIEHDLLVELSKQDLQSICLLDSIHLPVYKQIEKYEHVLHIVSEVHGVLKEKVDSIDALRACLPAGTVSGSPRQEAMQIIHDIEKVKRGVYAGGIGYIGFNRDINLAIAIRSLIIKEDKAYLQVGAGIVKQSIPEKEYEETLHKSRSLTNMKQIEEIV